MNDLQIETDYDAFYPGTEILTTVSWSMNTVQNRERNMEVRLVWNTSGKGDRDVGVVRRNYFKTDEPQGRKQISLKLPWGPYSFSGKLISLIWAIEFVVFPENDSVRKEIVIGPNSEEVIIQEIKKNA